MDIIQIFSKILSNPAHIKPYRDLIKHLTGVEKQAFEEIIKVRNGTISTNSDKE